MNLFFEQPAALEEVPYIDATGKWGNANYYYYLGSQIALTSVSLAIDGASPTFTSGTSDYRILGRPKTSPKADDCPGCHRSVETARLPSQNYWQRLRLSVWLRKNAR